MFRCGSCAGSGMEVFVLMDSGATPNALSPQLVKCLSLRPELMNNVVTVVNGNKSDVLGKAVNVSALFEQMEATMDFVVLLHIPFDLVTSHSSLKRLEGVLEFKGEEVRLDYRGQKAVLLMVLEYSYPRDQMEQKLVMRISFPIQTIRRLYMKRMRSLQRKI